MHWCWASRAQDQCIEANTNVWLLAVARLAKRCLEVLGEERPTMKEVAMEIEGLKRFVEHPWVHEEKQGLLGELEVEYSHNGNPPGQERLNTTTISADI
ncbi:hypothetical protein AAC387_Pa01g0724 [Persea americana]